MVSRRAADPIKKVVLADGQTRYRFVIDVGKKAKIDKRTGKVLVGDDGKPVMVRDQRTHTYDSHTEAKNKRAEIINDLAKGTYITESKLTVAEFLETWLAGRRDIRRSTVASYRTSLLPVTERLGGIPIQKLSKPQVDKLVDWMLKSGRRVGTKGLPLDPATVRRMLSILCTALDGAMAEGLVARNVARLVGRPVDPPKNDNEEDENETGLNTWTQAEAKRFLGFVSTDRLHAAWLMSLSGMRRGEVLGLRWQDVDLRKGELRIRKTRTIVDGEVVVSEPKSRKSKRTLPLDDQLIAALKKLKKTQNEEKLAAGTAYEVEPWVVVNEVGVPIHPESYSDKFEVQVRKAGVPKIRLHDTRHTCGTLLHLRGVPTAVIAAWLGHARASFTLATYVHSQDEALAEAGQMLGSMYGAGAPTGTS
jgi:integrase